MSLQDFRRLCESQGITGSFEIARYAAFLLLCREKWASWRGRTFSSLHNELTQAHQQLQRNYPGLHYIPPPLTPMLHQMVPIDPFIEALEVALSSSRHNSSLGEFFQREVRFQLLKDTSGNQYPTPYHIANLMAALAVTPRSMGVVDPAVGTGGLLAAAAGISSGCDILGCDFDRNMSELASANMLLHDYQNADIRLESALALWDIPAYRDNFDAVVMNPPFSGSRSVDETRHTVGERFGTSTVNVMTALVFKLLRTGGRAASLVPSGLLFGGGANARLRGFLAQHRLEAVITLDKECFQPFSHVDAHIVSVRKVAENEALDQAATWMCAVVRDGYPTGAGRDLTAEPDPAVNELPRIQELILQARQVDWPNRIVLPDATEIEALLLQPTGGLAGAAVRCKSSDNQVTWEVISIPSGVLVCLLDNLPNIQAIWHLPYRATTNVSIAAQYSKVITQMNWQELLDADGWADALPINWGGGTDDIALAVENDEGERTIELKVGKRSPVTHVFSSTEASTSPLQACLLDNTGQALGPWLNLQNDTLDLEDKTGETLQALTVLDAHNERCGWLLALTEAQGTPEEDDEQQTAWLMIVQPSVRCFTTMGMSHWAILLQTPDGKGRQGWIYGDANDASRLLLEVGELVTLRSNLPIQGFAVGTAPEASGITDTIFGVLVPHAQLVSADGEPYTFEPRAYLPEPLSVLVAHPSDVIASIRKNQARLGLRVDNLLQMLGSGSTREEESDSQTLDYLHSNLLDARQHQVWHVIQEINDMNGQPRLFTLSELLTECQAANVSLSNNQVVQTMMLLVRLGLVVEVHDRDHDGYCRVSAADLVR